ncbi:beta-lactamase family protein [Porticoccaceae bacterium]|nr:beta-lactamase family protein [Porticoccaceae bacterium]MDC0003345.1 beta-lactamase family protein [Porticoccaceae bacterium]
MPLFYLIEDDEVVGQNKSEAIVPWWSFTKTVIAAAALALVRDGKLLLDTPVTGKPFTLRQLLQHQSGLPDYGGLPEYHQAVEACEHPWSRDFFLQKVDTNKLLFDPGNGWQYSNIGYGLIGDIIEQTTGQDLDSSLQSLVLKPLGVLNTRIAREPDDLNGVLMGDAEGYHPAWVFHGLLIGPLREACLFLNRLMTGALLPQPLLNAMRVTHELMGVPLGERPWINPGYALGLMRGEVLGGLTIEGHTGEGPGSGVAVYHAPNTSTSSTIAVFHSQMDQSLVENTAVDALAGNRFYRNSQG